MQLKLITDTYSLLLCQRQWDELAGSFPFGRHAWLISWLEHLGRDAEPAVLLAVDDAPAGPERQRWLSVAPFCIQSNGLTRKLVWLGSGTACTDYQRYICAPEHLTNFSQAVAAWLSENIGGGKPLGRIDLVEMAGTDTSNPSTTIVIEAFESHGFQFHQRDDEGCWKVDLPSTWDELNRQFSKSMRRKTKKALQRLADSATTVRSSHDFPLEELWGNFVSLHQRRRSMLGQPGCFADLEFELFLHQGVERLAATGHAELLEIRHDSRPLASMLLLNDGHEVLMYQSGTCDSRSNLEPGYQLVALAMGRSIEQGFRSFDFLRGDEPYKARWNSRRIPISRLQFVPPHLSAQLMQTLWATGRSFKNYMGSFTLE